MIGTRYLLKAESLTEKQDSGASVSTILSESNQRLLQGTYQKTVYASAKECADRVGLLPTTLNERLKSNDSKVFKDGLRYRYY